MILKKLIEGLEVISTHGSLDRVIEHLTYSSKNAGPNSLFICVKGFKTDGHFYAAEAVQKGTVALLVEAPLKIEGVTVIQVADTRRAMAVVAGRFYESPDKQLNLIGVTGTNGKTSTTYMTKAILEAYGRQVGLIGTLETIIGNDRIAAVRTTPESLDIQYTFYKMLEASLDSCVMEVSSHSLELLRVEGVSFEIGIFTNLTVDHLDFHGDLIAYGNAKKKLFHQTRLANIINVDDDYGAGMAAEVKNLKTPLVTYGIEKQADFSAKNIVFDLQHAKFLVEGPDFQAQFSLKIPARFAVYNALAAIAAAHCLKIPVARMIEGLQEFQGVRGRFELVKEIQNMTVVIDFAHTPDALENVLKAARGFAQKRLITVFGCGGDRDKSKRPVMGEIAGSYSDLSIITADNPRTENPDDIIQMIELGMKKTHKPYTIINNRREAIRSALLTAAKGDMIMIVGKGHETYQILKDQIVPFDDRQVVADIAREEGIQ